MLLKDTVGKQLTKKYTLKRCTQGCTEVEFQGALNQTPLETDDMLYQKQKLAVLSHKSSLLCYMLHFTVSIKKILQNSCKTAAPINTAP